jgi:nucleoid-associated protein EbfC
MADIFKLMQQAQQMQGKLAEMQEELSRRTITGSAGGGMVTVECDGKAIIRRIRIEPSVVNPADVEMLEDLLTVAISDAQAKATALQADEMGKVAGGLNLPFKLPF